LSYLHVTWRISGLYSLGSHSSTFKLSTQGFVGPARRTNFHLWIFSMIGLNTPLSNLFRRSHFELHTCHTENLLIFLGSHSSGEVRVICTRICEPCSSYEFSNMETPRCPSIISEGSLSKWRNTTRGQAGFHWSLQFADQIGRGEGGFNWNFCNNNTSNRTPSRLHLYCKYLVFILFILIQLFSFLNGHNIIHKYMNQILHPNPFICFSCVASLPMNSYTISNTNLLSKSRASDVFISIF